MASRLRKGLVGLALLGLILAVGWCRSAPDTVGGSASLALSATAVQSRIAELAACPSPLERLGIERIRPKVMVGGDEIDLVIPAHGGGEGSMVRFHLDPVPGSGGSQIRLRWQVRLAGNAEELDLGEDRLLNPANLSRELDSVVESHIAYYVNLMERGAAPVSNRQRADKARNCRKAGRIIDAVAVVTNPALRQTIERQRRRDALGWLFKDDYQLRTGSTPGAYWESEADFGPTGF